MARKLAGGARAAPAPPAPPAPQHMGTFRGRPASPTPAAPPFGSRFPTQKLSQPMCSPGEGEGGFDPRSRRRLLRLPKAWPVPSSRPQNGPDLLAGITVWGAGGFGGRGSHQAGCCGSGSHGAMERYPWHVTIAHRMEGCPAQLRCAWKGRMPGTALARKGWKEFQLRQKPSSAISLQFLHWGSCSGAACQDKKEFQGQFPAINEAFSPREAVLWGREPRCTAKEGKGGSYPSAPALEEAARRDPQCHGTCQEEVWDLPLPGPASFPPSRV